ncbi:MAG TPA: cation diffusion facilitator family transporter [Candidatus Cloacimonadota bacterium]|nr:cation diffusion facilitator family transporter [Candidatus Cloacimonadota bacterium]
MKNRDQVASLTVNLGLFSNILLSIVKTAVGIIGHSPALLADGVNSTSDMVYYIAVKIFMHHAQKPADSEHPYGHRQLETISAIVVGAFILTTGIAIFWESVNKVYELAVGSEVGRAASFWVLVIALFTFVLKIFLFTLTKANTKKTGNPTLRALANDHFNDIMASLAVIVGVVLGRMGFYWMDPAAGAVVAIYIIKTGVEIIMESSGELMDSFPDEGFKKDVREIALGVPGVRDIEELGVHRFGTYFIINMTIGVDGQISVDDGHAISENIEARLLDRFGSELSKINIHYHPGAERHT